MATIVRFTAPQVVSATTAEVDSFTYHPHSGSVTVNYLMKAPDGTIVRQSQVTVSPIPGTVQTTLNTLVSRIYTYLQAQGLIPAGTEE